MKKENFIDWLRGCCYHPWARETAVAGSESTGLMKLLALLFMLCDHFGVVFFPKVTEFRIIGRMALPLYAWCIVVGCCRTRSMPRYFLRLLLLAVISQPLYMLALNHSWSDLNVVFLLALSVLVIWGIQENFLMSRYWALPAAVLLLCCVSIDYEWHGLLFILLLYAARKSKGGIVAVFIGYGLFWGATSSLVSKIFGISLVFLYWGKFGAVLQAFFHLQGMIWLALPLILYAPQKTFRMPAWLGYGLYPLHLALIILIRLLTGTPLSFLARYF